MRLLCLLAFFAVSLTTHARADDPTIFLVRHAEKAEPTPDRPSDPDLSAAGRARADRLAKALDDIRFSAIYATEFQRTQKTAAPIARKSMLGIATIPAKNVAALVAKLKKDDGRILVVGHSNTVPEIIKGLGVTTPVQIAETDYGDLFIVIMHAPQPELLHLHLP